MMRMDRESLRSALQQLMMNKFKLPIGELDDGQRLNEDLAVDSIMIIQLIVFLEVDLRLQVPDEQVDPRTFATIGSLLDFMEQLEPYPAESGAETALESR
ncbi:phosphopantetheine-binding protein [Paenibacillus soyae]|uniref:Phosphopantetheine-binding protein n=1 Tax=Paenibacillus soyae TaxID=2969249 RepID=A0A9X2SDH2_9BACL|nr:phosphopantetheine-binding protein [Paenibacillus soyae]MCR2807142.1 phosphopantetheine-binding protein [Paenibacillus soyae]